MMIKIKGFTLIELMIVVAIIGILATIALPAYQDYVIRSQMVESLVIIGELKGTVHEYYKHRGEFPKNNKMAGIPEPQYLLGNYVKRVDMVNGAFHITLGNKINKQVEGKILTIRPIIVKGSPASPFSWVCGNSSVPEGMEAIGENKTTVLDPMLPSACRI